MSLRARLSTVETCGSFRTAAEERFWDGFALATECGDRRMGAIYLFGYVAEILLKAAFYRAIGLADTAPVGLGAIRAHASWQGRNFHDIRALALLLVDHRRQTGAPFDPAFAGLLAMHAATVDANWNESLRYREISASDAEVVEVYRSVEWIRDNAYVL